MLAESTFLNERESVMEKIHTGLYGGKSFIRGVRDSKYLERAVYCDNYENCSLYKQGKCLRVVSGYNSTDCKYGKSETIEGYTPRAAKCSDFNKRVRSDAVYNKLEYPRNAYAAKIGDYLFLNTTCLKLDEENGTTKIDTSYSLLSKYIFIKADDIELLARILKVKPIIAFGYGVDKHYQDTIVPAILTDLRRDLPDIFKALTEKYPEFDVKPDYVGRTAYVSTLADGSVVKDNHSTYVYDKTNGTLTGTTREYVFGNYIDVSVTAKVDSSMTCEITDNSQVTEETVFC